MSKTDLKLKTKHLLSMADLSADEISGILDLSENFAARIEKGEEKIPSLKGKTVINVFFENSTRTRISFELAGKKLAADVINMSKSGSSAAKSETLYDTVKNLAAMKPDILVIRHDCSGAPLAASKIIDAAVINAGDGAHEHPTQALLDLLTIRQQFKKFAGLKVCIVGDIAHSRVARSNIIGLNKMGAKVTLVGPATMVPMSMTALGATVNHNLVDATRDADVIMMLRIQTERLADSPFPSVREYSKFYGLNEQVMQRAKSGVVIMHPGPVNRGVEISPEVADGPYSLILAQVTNGLYVRMALLHLLGAK